jgi:DNA-binding NtrC family response regulator
MTREEMEDQKMSIVLMGWSLSMWATFPGGESATLGDCPCIGLAPRPVLLETLEKFVYLEGVCGRIHLLGASWDDEAKWTEALTNLRKCGTEVVYYPTKASPLPASETLRDLLTVDDDATPVTEAIIGALLGSAGSYCPFRTAGAYGSGAKRGIKTAGRTVRTEQSPEATPEDKAYQRLMDAAQFYYRTYHDVSLCRDLVRYLLESVASQDWSARVKRAVAHFDRWGGRELLGTTPAMKTLRDFVDKVAKSREPASVFICGESGTGKETVAWLIHNKSDRRGKPFVAFNCASVAKELLESRFFGHEKGAFTDAKAQHKGLFEQADGGTLFLDEIGEMSLETQALLLRVLEERRFTRVGGSKEIEVDVRLVTATNRDLPSMVREGTFRQDLYYRLNVLVVRAPALREHKEDIPLIANAWWRLHRESDELTEAQCAALQGYDYPGNVRELFNLLERATVFEETDFAALIREHRELNAGLAAMGTDPADGRLAPPAQDRENGVARSAATAVAAPSALTRSWDRRCPGIGG